MTVMITLYLNNETTIFCNLYLGLNQPDTMTHAATYERLSKRFSLRTTIKAQNFISILSPSKNDIRIAHTKNDSFLIGVIDNSCLELFCKQSCNLSVAHFLIDVIQPQLMQVITQREE